MKTTIISVLVITLTSVAYAGGAGSFSGGDNGGAVQFKLDRESGPTCFNHDDIEYSSSGTYSILFCVWYCAPFYAGQKNAFAQLFFEKSNDTGGVWIKSGQYVTDGIC